MNTLKFYANVFQKTKENGTTFAKMQWSRGYTTKAAAIRGLDRKMKKTSPQGVSQFITAKPIARELTMDKVQQFINSQPL